MKLNTEVFTSSKDYFINKSISNSYPDIIGQVDKVINKYKNQLEKLKPKNDLNEGNIKYRPPYDIKENKYPEILKTDSTQYMNNITNNYDNNKKYSKTENNYIYEELRQEVNKYNEPNKSEYNFKYKSNKLNEFTNNNDNNQNNGNTGNIYKPFNNKYNLFYDINYEMENDNIKLGSALTLEKTKVVQLLNLLKMKENEINNLKQQIEKFEAKVNDIENKYQNIIYSIEQQQSLKLNDMYNNMSDEQNKLKIDYNEIKRNSEIQLEQINNELYNNRKIVKIFFDLFNKNIDLFNKTEIFPGIQIITENNYTEENAFLAVETLDKLIKKLVQDNKDLFNELVRLKGEIDNSNIIMDQNNNFIQQENTSLRKLVNNLKNENNYLKYNKSYNNIRTVSNRNNYQLSPDRNMTQINNREIINNQHHHIVHSVCRHCTPDCFRSNKNNTNRDATPIEKLKLKINNLEDQIRSQTYY